MTLTEFLLARIAEDEAAARGATGIDRPGSHWHWVTNETDAVVAHGDLEEAQEHQRVSLRTVEEYPTSSVGPLPAFALPYAEEVPEGVGWHIARWDPARVLAECEAKRRVVEEYTVEDGTPAREGENSLLYLAAVYADHPDYREEWKP